MSRSLTKVLIAGIGGASLGTEVLKSLIKAGGYKIYGCDISKYAFGHYQKGFVKTFVVNEKHYIKEILKFCVDNKIGAIIPGGEEPLYLLKQTIDDFDRIKVVVATNTAHIIDLCSNKGKLFEHLKNLKIPIPQTIAIDRMEDFVDFSYPCIIKPSLGTGGSKFVFLSSNKEETNLYLRYILNNAGTALIQEYITHEEGEFTIGVLSLPDGTVAGSVVMQRLFNAKLSVLLKTKFGLISSGYSQGLIDEFTDIRKQAENIAISLGSKGPLNIQGRLHNGILIPFEINPRFSASTHLRTMAGFNEIDVYLKNVIHGEKPTTVSIKPGLYLRSLSEIHVNEKEIK